MSQEQTATLELALTGTVGAAQVDELRDEWLAACWPGRSVRLDLAGIEGMHTAAVQLVLALRRRVEEAGGAFEIAGASLSARQAAASLGLTGALGIGDPA